MSRELQVAVAAARAGAAQLAAARGGDLRIDYKDARANLVTIADRRSQQAITDVILGAFPAGHAIDGEEGTAGEADAEHIWYVDPLDGTTNYAHGLPFFCVSIALRSFARRGKLQPARRQRERRLRPGPRRAVRGGQGPAARRLRTGRRFASPPSPGSTGRLSSRRPSPSTPAQIAAYERLAEQLMSVAGGVRSLGLARASTLCAIAAGRLDAYCEYTMDAWDIAAGQLILQEAGGTLTLFDGGPHETAERADVVASNGHIHLELISSLKGLSLSDYQYPAALPVTTTGGWARPGWWDVVADGEKSGTRFGPAGQAGTTRRLLRARHPRPGVGRPRHAHRRRAPARRLDRGHHRQDGKPQLAA